MSLPKLNTWITLKGVMVNPSRRYQAAPIKPSADVIRLHLLKHHVQDSPKIKVHGLENKAQTNII